MPLPTEKLTKESSKEAVQAAISACIKMARHEGREGAQAVAMCYSSARKHAGSRSYLKEK